MEVISGSEKVEGREQYGSLLEKSSGSGRRYLEDSKMEMRKLSHWIWLRLVVDWSWAALRLSRSAVMELIWD